MEIGSTRNKGLRRLFDTGNPKGWVDDAAEGMDALFIPPNFGLYGFAGNRKGTWSMTVTSVLALDLQRG